MAFTEAELTNLQIPKINFKLHLKFQHTTNESDTGFTPSSGLKTDVIS